MRHAPLSPPRPVRRHAPVPPTRRPVDRRQAPHLSQHPRAPREGARDQRRAAGAGHLRLRHGPGLRPWAAPPDRPHRDDAARGLRADGGVSARDREGDRWEAHGAVRDGTDNNDTRRHHNYSTATPRHTPATPAPGGRGNARGALGLGDRHARPAEGVDARDGLDIARGHPLRRLRGETTPRSRRDHASDAPEPGSTPAAHRRCRRARWPG